MLNYENLRDEFCMYVNIYQMDLSDKPFDGLYFKKFNAILLEKEMTEQQKNGLLLEEWGHYNTCTKNILDKTDPYNAKQEQWGIDYAVKNFISIDLLKEAVRNASDERTNYEIAEYMNIDVEFLGEVVKFYKRKGEL